MAKPRISLFVILPPIIFLSLAVTFYIGLSRNDPNALPSTLVGQTAPPFDVAPLGTLPMVTDATLRNGDIHLVNIWASWCGPCRQEHPLLQKLSDAGVKIAGLNYKDSPANALGFLDELGNPYSHAAAIEGRAALDWGVYGVPETFLVNGKGEILLRTAGPLTQRTLEQLSRSSGPEAQQILRDTLLPAITAN